MTGDPKAEEITKKQFIAWYEAIFPAPPPEEPEEEEAEGLAAVGASCFSCVRKSRARLEAKYADAKAFAEKHVEKYEDRHIGAEVMKVGVSNAVVANQDLAIALGASGSIVESTSSEGVNYGAGRGIPDTSSDPSGAF